MVKHIAKQIFLLGVNGLGVVALCLVAYAYAAFFTGDHWKTLNSIANWLSAWITSVGLAFIALSVYMPMHARRPNLYSRWVTAPLALMMVGGAATVSIITGKLPPPIAINGFAILAITGSVFRTLPFSDWSSRGEPE